MGRIIAKVGNTKKHNIMFQKRLVLSDVLAYWIEFLLVFVSQKHPPNQKDYAFRIIFYSFSLSLKMYVDTIVHWNKIVLKLLTQRFKLVSMYLYSIDIYLSCASSNNILLYGCFIFVSYIVMWIVKMLIGQILFNYKCVYQVPASESPLLTVINIICSINLDMNIYLLSFPSFPPYRYSNTLVFSRLICFCELCITKFT